jgi:outer membrane scaffolding protein for murein synthesis (MipA/OmpV family)
MRTILATAAAVALSSGLAAQGSPSNDASTVTVGAAVAVSPRYPGSDEHRLRPFPTVEWTLGSRHIIAIAGTSATFADAKQMRRDFGVTGIEASQRQNLIDAGDDRLRASEGQAYRPDGGLRQVGGSLTVIYLASARWSVLGFGSLDRLSDEAAASPLVRQRDQYSGGLGLRWRL